MAGIIVAFDYEAWRAEFPEFTALTQARATGFFNRATILHSNDGTGPVSTAAIQSSLLNLVTAHLAALSLGPNGSALPSNTPPGRITTATEGTVTAVFDLGAPGTSTQAFWTQTRYGTEYWTATRVYRTMHSVPGPVRSFGPRGSFGGGYGSGNY